MPTPDQLEIINPSGEIGFFDLDPGKGIANIGRHPENDLVLDSPEVALFHAVLDHRQKPYRLVVLSQEGEASLRHAQAPAGQSLVLPSNVSTPLQNWDTVQLGNYTIILLEDGLAPGPSLVSAGPIGPTRPLPARPAAIPPPTRRPEGAGIAPPAAATPPNFSGPLPDITDEVVITEFEERERIVHVEQTATYQLTIINGGGIVATFEVAVEGIPREWVQIMPPHVNLFEGSRELVTINITPPRLSTSRAGMHHLAFNVTSPNYVERYSRRSAVLTIEPYHEFAVGELSPKRQSISWFKSAGQARISITNRGNGEAPFRITGEDDERGCSFEFDVPGEPVGLARQADLRIAPDETVYIPIEITPHKRRLIGLRKHIYSYTVTSTLLEEHQTPRSLLGDLRTGPLIGPLLILLIIFFIISSIMYFFWPEVTIISNPGSIRAGQEVTLHWGAFPPFFVDIKVDDESVEVPRGSRKDRPIKTTTYEATANTWLSQLLPFFTGRDRTTVEVTPIKPEIGLFKAEPQEITGGETTVLSWFVVGADKLTLIDLASGAETELGNPASSVRLTPDKDITYVLKAVNNSLPDQPIQKAVDIIVTAPTPVPLNAPVIEFFLAQPSVIEAGQSVVLQWSVSGVDTVSVQPIGDDLPPASPPIAHMPQETTLYVLSATNGQETVNEVRQVVVNQAPTPTPTPPPGQPPVIEFFGVTPEEAVRVEPERDDTDNQVTAQLNWVVTGQTTNVEITGGPPGYEKLSNLPRKGEVSIDVLDTTVFVLTAYNGQESVVKTAQIQFLDPTPTPDAGSGDGSSGGGDGGGGDGAAAPAVLSFTAEGVSSADEVDQVGDDPPTYEVEAGSNVNLIWTTENADTVTLVGVGDQPPAGTYTVSNVVSNRTFQLTAQGTDSSDQAFVVLQVVARPVPPPPYNVNGTTASPTAADITLTWDHDAENEIIGFRVYRATSSGGPFSRVADESQLASSARLWVDANAFNGTCRAYYVTAVYEEPASGDHLETGTSANSWFSPDC